MVLQVVLAIVFVDGVFHNVCVFVDGVFHNAVLCTRGTEWFMVCCELEHDHVPLNWVCVGMYVKTP